MNTGQSSTEATRCVGVPQTAVRTTRLGRRYREAIAALIAQPTVALAASQLGVSTQTLLRWKQKPEVDAALTAALVAEHEQSMARMSQGGHRALQSIRQILHQGTTPALRLTAAILIADLAPEVIAIIKLRAEVAELERATTASQAETGSLPTEHGSAITGHGAKFPRKMKRAVAELLVRRNVAQAAQAAGVGTQTLYDWMAVPQFIAALAEAAGAAFESTAMAVLRDEGNAVSLIWNYEGDPDIPEATRLKAAAYTVRRKTADEIGRLKACVAALDSVRADAANTMSGSSWKMIGKNLYQTVQRLKSRLSPAHWPHEFRMVYAHALDGNPAGLSVIGADGGPVWLVPPAGCKTGEPVEETDDPVDDTDEPYPEAA